MKDSFANRWQSYQNKDNFIQAKLLNLYLWLYDYYNIKNTNKDKILEIENNIKNLSQNIYELLIKNDRG